jgi:hypothetical protein
LHRGNLPKKSVAGPPAEALAPVAVCSDLLLRVKQFLMGHYVEADTTKFKKAFRRRLRLLAEAARLGREKEG